jgi:integrase
MKTRSPENPDTTTRNPQSGQEVAKQNVLGHFSKAKGEPRRSLPRSHSEYWKARLFRPTYTRDGQVCEVNDLAVRIQHGGRRETFTLATTNKDAAAIKARDIWTTVKGAGWDAAIAKFKPDQDTAPKVDVTVGDLLEAVKRAADLRPRTFQNYANCIRTIVADAFGIRPAKGTSKFDYRAGGHQEWVLKIDAIKLARLTAERITEWQRERVANAGKSEIAKASARRTCNSYVRCARSLFSPRIVRNLKQLTLPEPHPFAGVELLETGSMKYVSRIHPATLVAAAKSELKKKDPEAYKAFLLALFAGMRKAEIDLAEWSMVDFGKEVIRLQETEWLHLKTRDSAADITVEEQFFDELRGFMRKGEGPFVLKSNRPPRNDSVRTYYRCEETFDRLNAWLRSKGIKSNKPLHELRKEVGAIVATTLGIYAASRYLRHSDITTTARHYADHKERITTGLGKLLDTKIKAVSKAALAAA